MVQVCLYLSGRTMSISEDALKELDYIKKRRSTGEADLDQAKFEAMMVMVTFIETLGFEQVVQAFYEATDEF